MEIAANAASSVVILDGNKWANGGSVPPTPSKRNPTGECANLWIDPPKPRPQNLEEKLQVFDLHCQSAVDFVVSWAEENREALIAKARARHISGHHVHGDGKLYEFDSEQLSEEFLEELADAVVYRTRQIHLSKLLSESSI